MTPVPAAAGLPPALPPPFAVDLTDVHANGGTRAHIYQRPKATVVTSDGARQVSGLKQTSDLVAAERRSRPHPSVGGLKADNVGTVNSGHIFTPESVLKTSRTILRVSIRSWDEVTYTLPEPLPSRIKPEDVLKASSTRTTVADTRWFFSKDSVANTDPVKLQVITVSSLPSWKLLVALAVAFVALVGAAISLRWVEFAAWGKVGVTLVAIFGYLALAAYLTISKTRTYWVAPCFSTALALKDPGQDEQSKAIFRSYLTSIGHRVLLHSEIFARTINDSIEFWNEHGHKSFARADMEELRKFMPAKEARPEHPSWKKGVATRNADKVILRRLSFLAVAAVTSICVVCLQMF